MTAQMSEMTSQIEGNLQRDRWKLRPTGRVVRIQGVWMAWFVAMWMWFVGVISFIRVEHSYGSLTTHSIMIHTIFPSMPCAPELHSHLELFFIS